MIWMNLLTDLAMSLFFWPAAFNGLGLDQPQVAAQQPCPCSPCLCKEKCPCDTCVLGPGPAGTIFIFRPNCGAGCERVGLDFAASGMPIACGQSPMLPTTCANPPCQSCQQCPATIACPNGCCQANGPMPFQSYTMCPMTAAQPNVCCPCMGPIPFSVPPAAAMPCQQPMTGMYMSKEKLRSESLRKAYEVRLRFDQGIPEQGCICPKVTLVEGGDALVSMQAKDASGNPGCRMIHVHLGKVVGDCVPVRLSVTPPPVPGKPVNKLQVEQTVHFDTVTGVVLSGNTPEPYLGEVVVSPWTPSKMNPRAELTTLPRPVPASGFAMHSLPPPAPIAPSGSYCSAAPPTCYPPLPPPNYLPSPTFIQWMPIPEPMPMARQPITLATMPAFANPSIAGPMKVYTIHRTARISVVHEEGKAKLQMMKDGVSSTAVRMTLETDEIGNLRFAAGQQHVHLSGKMWKAVADHVEMYDDGKVILTGHVKIVSDKVGVCSSLKADHVCLRIKHGRVEKIAGGLFTK
jgi:hypothetical protein